MKNNKNNLQYVMLAINLIETMLLVWLLLIKLQLC